MSLKRIALLCGVAPLGLVAMPAHAADQPSTPAAAAAETGAPSGDIIVTARRQNERLQDVPIAVSVVSPTVIASKGVFTPVDIAQSAPGLAVTATTSDRNNLTYTIRGQGFSYGTLFPAVITYFNEVPITQLTTGQFFDIADIQVLRGPQGVDFGRVTDGGNVMVNAQAPKNDFGGYLTVKLGDYNLRTVNGALNIPIVQDKILFRGAFEISRRDGFTRNVETGENLDNVAYESYRAGLTLKPTETLTNSTTVSYQRTHDNGTAVVFSGANPTAIFNDFVGLANPAAFGTLYSIAANGDIVPFNPSLTPFTAANVVASQQALLAAQQARGPRKVAYNAPSFDRRKNLYIVSSTTAQLSDTIQLKNIFGYTNVKDFEASNFAASNGSLILTCHSSCGGNGGGGSTLPFNSQEQFSEELRLSGKSFDNMLTWSIGGYADKQKPATAFENDTINVGIIERDGVQYATTTSKAVYASGEYDLGAMLPGLKVNGGIRYTHDTVRSLNATYLRPTYFPDSFAPPIPYGKCQDYVGPLGVATCQLSSAAFNAVTWTGGVSYKPSRALLLYAKVSKGYRPGGVNGTAPEGVDPSYNPEYDLSVEVGVKGDFSLGGDARLRTNIAAYHDHYTNILKNVTIAGPNGVPLSLEQNVDNGTIQGVELEATLIPVRGLSFGGTFAYTDAKFSKKIVNDPGYDPNSCNPNAAVFTGFCPYNQFNAVPKTQFSLSADYTLPLGPSIGDVSVGGRYYHQSSVSLSDTSELAPFATQKAYGTLDLNATWANVFGKPFDLAFFMTNVTNKLYRIGSNDLSYTGSVGVRGDIYAAPRMFGFSLKYRFGTDAHGG